MMEKEENSGIIIIAMIFGAIILGLLLLKGLFDSNTEIHRCPTCSLVITKGTTPCPRCRTNIAWS